MALIRKKRKAAKVPSATLAPEKSPKSQDKPRRAEALIVYNGKLIEALLAHEGWKIVEELIDEGVASVVGRKTNGYYYDGDLNRGAQSKDYLTGYQQALTQLNNRIKDFIRAKARVIANKKLEEADNKAPIYNPFLEELNEEE